MPTLLEVVRAALSFYNFPDLPLRRCSGPLSLAGGRVAVGFTEVVLRLLVMRLQVQPLFLAPVPAPVSVFR